MTLDERIRDAILLACEDMTAADERLVELREEALGVADHAAALACLKALSVITSVTDTGGDRRLRVCRALVREDPENPSSWISLGQAEEERRRFAAAGRAYLAALELSTDRRTDRLLKESLDRVARALV